MPQLLTHHFYSPCNLGICQVLTIPGKQIIDRVNSRHRDKSPGLAGWFSADKQKQFDMARDLYPAEGAGKLQILVPSGADLRVTGDVGVGGYSVATIRRRKYYWVDVSRRTRGGVDMTIDESIEGTGGDRPIKLSVHTSAGEVEIDRVVTST